MIDPAVARTPLVTPSLEIHIPISPTEPFLLMARCFVESLRLNGGPHADAKVVLTVGDDRIDPSLDERVPWAAESGVEIRWVDEQRFASHALLATGAERFSYEFGSDIVMLMDADILVARPFDDLIRRAFIAQCMVARIGETSPWLDEPHEEPWRDLYAHLGCGPVPYAHEHPGFGRTFLDQRLRYCPAYFNLGMLAAPPGIMHRLGAVMYELLDAVSSFEFTRKHFAAQLAVGVATVREHIPYLDVAMRFNFLNHRNVHTVAPEEAEDVRLIHVTRKLRGDMDKRVLFSDPSQLAEFARARDVVGINRQIQGIVREIYPRLMRTPTLLSA